MSGLSWCCKHCQKSFSRRNNCFRHERNVHNDPANDDSKKYACALCSKTFKEKSHLQAHINAIHLLKKREKIFQCHECGYKTDFKKNLKRHIFSKNHEKNREKTGTPGADFQCPICTAHYSWRKNLQSHMRKQHNLGKPPITVKRKCPLCPFLSSDFSKKEIYSHFESMHDLNIKSQTLNFESFEDFEEWKRSMEGSTHSSFVNRVVNGSTTFYTCHRSGYYKKTGCNKRQLKISGSSKINGFCPAIVKCKKLNNGSVQACYIPTHIGHKTELMYLRLSPKEKNQIASKIAEKTNYGDILREIRNSATDTDLKRIHLATRQDIINIRNSLNLVDEATKLTFDPVNIEAWVNEMRLSKDTALLVYKPQGTLRSDFPGFKEEDFSLIYMSQAQKTTLEKHGHDVICIDGRHRVNNYNFQLCTLLVLDDIREGYPVAFLFTNRGDESTLLHFFHKLHSVVGVINPQVFMSDTEETFYLAWAKIMGEPQKRLFCNWHVLNAWNANIHSKIKDKEKQDGVKQILQALLCEMDEEAFKTKLQGALNKLSNDSGTLLFHEYFCKYYVCNEKVKRWAQCYRINAGINSNISLENFNRVLNYCYLKCRDIKMLDINLCAVLNLVKDKMFDLLIKMKNDKLVKILRILRNRHNTSLLMKDSNAIQFNDNWLVTSTTIYEQYTVKKVKDCKVCQFICMHCNVCVHEFICSCTDSAIKNNMCKHIHFVASLSVDRKNSSPIIEDVNVEFDILQEVSETTISTKNKKILEVEVTNLLKYVERRTLTDEKVNYIRKSIKQIQSTLEAMDSANN